jgi:signal transduction histidine kinase
MADTHSNGSDRALGREQTGGSSAREAQRALQERPIISLRARIAAVFLVILVLLCGTTVTAILFIREFKAKALFLETVGDYLFEVQEARRYEKNFFLYGTGLSDALASVHLARGYLEHSSAEIESVIGSKQYADTRKSLSDYSQLLERALLVGTPSGSGGSLQARKIEADLRRHGARILGDAEKMIDEERLSLHAMLHTYTLAAFGFLGFMCIVIAYVASFIIRAVLRPLGRFVEYTARIGEGDYSPIRPARKYRDEFSNLAIALNQMLAELALREEQLTQSAKMAAVGTLTSGIAHELNNPLNNIGVTAEALLDGYDEYSDEEKRKMLGEIERQLERASGTVRNLLDFTRKEQPAYTAVSVGDVVEGAIRLAGNEIRLGGVELKQDIDADLPDVRGNPRDLQQVLLNLLLNGIQAMPEGGTLSIRASTAGDGFVRVDVKDTGVGIPAEDLDKVFDPFYTTKDPGKGTGLGLSVAYSTVDRHGGRICVESEPGKGAVFSVYLPGVTRSRSNTEEVPWGP